VVPLGSYSLIVVVYLSTFSSYSLIVVVVVDSMVKGLMLVVNPGWGSTVVFGVIVGPVVVSGSSGNWQQSSVLSKVS